MNAIDLLIKQHRDVDELFERIENESDDALKVDYFNELADMLAVHATIEERIFYPAVREKKTEDILEESLQEHLQMKRALVDIMQDTLDGNGALGLEFRAKCKVLKEEVEHHVKEEEKELFPKVKNIFDDEQLEALGQTMTALMVELEEKGTPRDDVFNQVEEPVRVGDVQY